MFSYDGKKRPTIDEIRNHPWMAGSNSPNMGKIRSDLVGELAEKRSTSTNATSREDVNARGDGMLDLVRQTSALDHVKFNDMADFDLEVDPGVVWDDVNNFNSEQLEGKMTIEKVEGKCIKMSLPQSEDNNALTIKIKFFKTSEDEGAKTRVRFVKKTGDINQWYSMFKEMKDAGMDEILLAPQRPELV